MPCPKQEGSTKQSGNSKLAQPKSPAFASVIPTCNTWWYTTASFVWCWPPFVIDAGARTKNVLFGVLPPVLLASASVPICLIFQKELLPGFEKVTLPPPQLSLTFTKKTSKLHVCQKRTHQRRCSAKLMLPFDFVQQWQRTMTQMTARRIC